MAIRRVICFIAVCDLCGRTVQDMGDDDFAPHLGTAAEAIAHATAHGDSTAGWALTGDGWLVCDDLTDIAHRAAHRAAGKHMDAAFDPGFGPDSMHMEFATVRADEDFRL
ncbi:hypothetical protein [Streptomyces huiliensis]|uniref:hypothetical protein n=1 Tax=Streptomyces huiliensis TaxID=2876027 RepID=UPI001CBF30B1|nr:hypothetical protein [Streptomyces huiliensis]MBZ4319406.1 hypothetical protein [Streptomyces huiliensis]